MIKRVRGRNNAPASTDGDYLVDAAQREQAADRRAAANASQWRLVWRRFRKHKLAMVSAAFLLLVYLIALFADFVAPFATGDYDVDYTYAPPQPLRVIERTDDGSMRWNPYVAGYDREMDPISLRYTYHVDESVRHELTLFARGEPYTLLGLFETDIRLIGPKDPDAPMYLLGADRQGRDILSRVIHGTRVSMSVGLVGVALSFVIGVTLGGISGYFGGGIDSFVQRLVEVLVAIPAIPLWMGLSAALPRSWSSLQVYFAITVILSLVGWTALGREVRGRFFSLREEDFVTAARLDGAKERRIIFRHMMPSMMSHLVATVTLAIPTMIIAETSLSFLGLGLQPPIVSWGVLLQEAQNVRTIATAPWLLIVPATACVTCVLALNFLGDGLRDAADPYS